MEFSIGDHIGKFRVVREVGHGGMGCVYEVVADGDATHLALKAFTLDHGNREFLKNRFLAEAKILSRLRHLGPSAIDTAEKSTTYKPERFRKLKERYRR